MACLNETGRSEQTQQQVVHCTKNASGSAAARCKMLQQTAAMATAGVLLAHPLHPRLQLLLLTLGVVRGSTSGTTTRRGQAGGGPASCFLAETRTTARRPFCRNARWPTAFCCSCVDVCILRLYRTCKPRANEGVLQRWLRVMPLPHPGCWLISECPLMLYSRYANVSNKCPML